MSWSSSSVGTAAPLHFFALSSFAGAPDMTGALNRAAGYSWGVPWYRGARVEVRAAVGRKGHDARCHGAWAFVPSAHHFLLLCCLLQGPQVWQGLRIGLIVFLGSAMGPRCACRGEAGVGRVGRGANGRGGHGSSCLHRIMLFCSAVFCKGLKYGRGFGSGCWLLLGSAMGPRCAC